MRAGQSGAHPKTERLSRQFFAGSQIHDKMESTKYGVQ